MSVARRTLLTATAAGTVLGALWFVPSANASGEAAAHTQTGRTQQVAAVAHVTGATRAAGTTGTTSTAEESATLAETGAGAASTPYVIGGTALLGVGAGFVRYAVRRSPAEDRA